MQLLFEVPQAVQGLLVGESVRGLAVWPYQCAREQFEAVRPGCQRHRAIRKCIYEEIPDEARFCERLLDVVPASDVQRFESIVWGCGITVDVCAMSIHRLDMRLQLRPVRKAKLARNNELRLCELHGGLECIERTLCDRFAAYRRKA